MDILTSGSFINLENQGKIEQLIFTAREIAGVSVETEGFVNSEEDNRRLGLEIWHGAEYLCRATEEAAIRSIFINNFLERLRELRGAAGRAETPPGRFSDTLTSIESPIEKDESPGDEFLGIVEADEGVKPETPAAAVSPEMPCEVTESEDSHLLEPSDPEIEDNVLPTKISDPKGLTAGQGLSGLGETGEIPVQINSNPGLIQPEAGPVVHHPNKTAGAITLADKEPYRWDHCTVTATIQMLPTDSGIRRVVLSVRTHDFAPLISVVELPAEVSPEKLLPALETVFESYRRDLPLKAIDKLKKEKAGVKKTPSKTAATEVRAGGCSNTEAQAGLRMPRTGPVGAAQPVLEAVMPKTEGTVQGTLFG